MVEHCLELEMAMVMGLTKVRSNNFAGVEDRVLDIVQGDFNEAVDIADLIRYESKWYAGSKYERVRGLNADAGSCLTSADHASADVLITLIIQEGSVISMIFLQSDMRRAQRLPLGIEFGSGPF